MNDLIRFDFQGNQVRTLLIEDDPWWIAKDVCDVLELEARDSVRYLDDDEKTYVSRKHIGVEPGKDMLIISEPGLYSLILRSRKPEAKAFKRWITHEVIPQIRKTGGYGLPGSSEVRMDRLESMVEKLVVAVAEIPKTINQMVKALPAASAPALESAYFTVKAYAIKIKQQINLQTARALGIEARRLSIQRRVPFHKVADEQFGVVNSYHISVLKEVFTV